MSLEIYKKMKIENELKKLINEGYSLEDAAVYLVDNHDKDDINYIIEACIMPIDEITNEIIKYDSALDEVNFINELCRKYKVDKKSIIDRIQNVRSINKQNEIDTPKRLEDLKRKRDLLQKEKDKLSNKSMDAEEKSMYYFGLGIVTFVGGVLFYSSSPILVALLPVTYAVSLPTIRLSSLYKKEFYLINELVDLDKEIDILDKKLNSNEFNDKVFIQEIECTELPLNYNYDIKEEILNDSDKKEESGPRLIKRMK